MSANCDYLMKVSVIGTSFVGKTCFLDRFVTDCFISTYEATIGGEFKIGFLTTDDGKKIKFQLWDTAGEEKTRSVAPIYYRNSQGIFIVYDTTRLKSFEDVSLWLNDVLSFCPTQTVKILIGNKVDLETERQVSFDQGKKLAADCNIYFLETSAKTGLNVQMAFEEIASQIRVAFPNNPKTRQAFPKKSTTSNSFQCC